MKKNTPPKNHRFRTAIFILLFYILSGPVAASGQFRTENSNTVIDQSGRRIVVDKPYKRIISLYGAHTENLFSLGLDEEIIGVTRHESHPARALTKPVFSYHDDPEKFLAARPDLVMSFAP